jgi:hypothetical protein
MTAAILTGVSSGAVHAVTGPDHLLSLAPLAMRGERASWKVGLIWGLGHGVGTLAVGLAAATLVGSLNLEAWASVGERLAGAALIAVVLWSLLRARLAVNSPESHQGQHDQRGSVFGVGLVHGVSGAFALLLLLPLAIGKTAVVQLTFLLAFALGSAAAMSLMTSWLSAASRRVSPSWLNRIRYGVSALALGLGSWWLLQPGV